MLKAKFLPLWGVAAVFAMIGYYWLASVLVTDHAVQAVISIR
jgi:hypothetical protein